MIAILKFDMTKVATDFKKQWLIITGAKTREKKKLFKKSFYMEKMKLEVFNLFLFEVLSILKYSELFKGT